MTVDGSHDVGPGLVYSRMDGEARWRDMMHIPRRDDGTFLIDQTQVIDGHVFEGFAKGIDPEVV